LHSTPKSDHSLSDHRTHGVPSWFFTTLIVIVLIGGAIWWRARDEQSAAQIIEPSVESVVLPRTRALIDQKTESLTSYNEQFSIEELATFLSQHVGRTVTPETFQDLGRVVINHIIPNLWLEAQEGNNDKPYVTQQAISAVLQKYYPREVLPNADVILYPEDTDLRIVVAEPPQDHFRDSGWHWRWIGRSVEALSPEDAARFKELDVYAAEVLSEFLSVFGVALFKLAARRAAPSDTAINSDEAMDTLKAMRAWSTRQDKAQGGDAETRVSMYSEEAKMRLVYAIPKPMFVDITQKAKLKFTHRPKPIHMQRRIELEVPLGIAGGGVAAADFDGDGWHDLYFAGDDGGRLFRNVSGKHLEEISHAVGVNTDQESRAGYFVDYDNDGDLDLYLTIIWDSNRLYENDGSGQFQDVTERVGLKSGKYITHEAVWFDMDNDGLLDVYTGNFGTWTEGAVPLLDRHNTNAGPNRLYRQYIEAGEHRFEEIGQAMGVDDHGWTHCVGAWDYDQDGFLDLFSLNDFGASLVYHNIGGKAFEEVSRALHLDTTYNAMNFTLLDLNHDGHSSIYVSEIMTLMHRQRYIKPTDDTKMKFTAASMANLRALVQNCLYSKKADGTYENVHDIRMEPANLGWSWDASTFDYENDADLDMLVLNGTESEIPTREEGGGDKYLFGRTFLKHHNQQTNVFYASEGGFFYNVSDFCPLSFEGNSRGSAFFDFDHDGDLDVAIASYGSHARLFENVQQMKNNWIRFHLTGKQSNRSAIGARLEVRFGDEVRYDQVVSGSGFLSQNPYTLHFGLGKAKQVDTLVITWPSGGVQELVDLEANETHGIAETDKK
jgi:hypothetical protein